MTSTSEHIPGSAGVSPASPPEYDRALARAEAGERLERREIASLIGCAAGQERLLAAADRVRQRALGPAVHLRALVEFSNHCRQDCAYCGLRAGNATLPRYRMAPQQVVDTALAAARLGYGTCVLQSGEDPAYDAQTVAGIVRAIKAQSEMAVTLSVGERPEADYAAWREAGADRYLLKIETTDPALFARLRPGRTLQQRIACLQALGRLGYQVGSGFMVGLPAQSLDSLAGDLAFLRDLPCHMAGIGPFIPHPQTPLAGEPSGDLDLVLRCLAVARLLLPYAHLAATTASATLHPQGRQRALAAGADVIMPNVTPERYRVHYEIYPGKIAPRGDMPSYRRQIEALIVGEGRTVGQGRGDYGG